MIFKFIELVCFLWLDREIISDDFVIVDVVIFWFIDFLVDVLINEYLLVLSFFLKEWNVIFEGELIKESFEVDDGFEWGEGWEECDNDIKIYVLYLCWKSILKKLIVVGFLRDVL